jgi:NADH:ubiquinone oxidoreductase subunit 5 (subunit L)/multisubunit Na+/H+ antiporter MnhA subunit
MWMSHHFWHENITFFKFNEALLVADHISDHYGSALFIAFMILIAAAAKSAQLPFSSWLPRAMEGPTTSSAIFYGSLSVHLGVFILLRSFPFWSGLLIVKIAVILIGLLTGFIATGIASVQSSVKTQIAYASIAQIGIIFIEVALGFHTLALFHFAGNAFLRTYQLLVSPSVLSYLIHHQFYNFDPHAAKPAAPRFKKIIYSLYMLSVKEWNLDFILHRLLWTPFKWMGKKLHFLNSKGSIVFLAVIYSAGLCCFAFEEKIPASIYAALAVIYAFLALALILKAFAERGDAIKAWLLVFAGQFFIALAIALNEHFEISQVIIYLSGGTVSAVAGYLCLKKIKSIDNDIELNGFHGYVYEQPALALIFLLSCLGILGFPISPTFIGIDLLFSHIRDHQLLLIGFIALCFVFIELSVMRIYARIFMGQHKKPYHAIAFRSS